MKAKGYATVGDGTERSPAPERGPGRRTSLPRVLFVVGVGALLSGAIFWERGPEPLIYPPQRIPVHFSHDYHVRKPDRARNLEGEGLSCDFCHENISDSEVSSDRDIPGHDTCESCHADWIGDEDEPAPITDCARCHRDLDPAGTSTRAKPLDIPPPNLQFSHKLHLGADLACTDCHSDVPKKTVATRDDYPTMDRCISCHTDREASTKCTVCHLAAPSGRVQTAYPEGRLKPARYHSFAIHDGDFLRDHAVPAQRDRAYCESCHGPDDCLACHDGIGRDTRYHPGDWMAMHPLRARKDDVRCESCHRLQTFCLDCHVRSGVATVGTLTDPSTRRTIRRTESGTAIGPHPMAHDGWLDPNSRNFHGFHAQRNMRACASCHQEQTCIVCHASSFPGTSPGVNPHGPNPERLKGTAASRRNARVCLKCHHPGDASWR